MKSAAEREAACGIRQSAMENHGREWEIFDNDRDWFRQIDAKTRAKFDYILADTRQSSGSTSRRPTSGPRRH